MSTDTTGNEQSPRAFGSPFDDSDADVVFRSSDQVDFYLYKNILAKSSPVFKNMFSIPQSLRADDTKRTRDPRPIVNVTENASVISTLLAFCYPTPQPQLEDLEEISAVIAAAKKYQMDWVHDEMGAIFSRSPQVVEHPFRAFHIAYNHGLKREVHVAARAMLQLDLGNPATLAGTEDLELLSGLELRRLLIYHEQCRTILSRQGMPKETLWITKDMTVFDWIHGTSDAPFGCGHRSFAGNYRYMFDIMDHQNERLVYDWWGDYMKNAVSVLSTRPWPPLVCTLELTGAAFLTNVTNCNACCETVAKRIQMFSRVFCQHLEKCIEKVEVELPFS